MFTYSTLCLRKIFTPLTLNNRDTGIPPVLSTPSPMKTSNFFNYPIHEPAGHTRIFSREILTALTLNNRDTGMPPVPSTP